MLPHIHRTIVQAHCNSISPQDVILCGQSMVNFGENVCRCRSLCQAHIQKVVYNPPTIHIEYTTFNGFIFSSPLTLEPSVERANGSVFNRTSNSLKKCGFRSPFSSPRHKHWPAGPVHFSDRRASSGQYISSFTGPYGPPRYMSGQQISNSAGPNDDKSQYVLFAGAPAPHLGSFRAVLLLQRDANVSRVGHVNQTH